MTKNGMLHSWVGIEVDGVPAASRTYCGLKFSDRGFVSDTDLNLKIEDWGDSMAIVFYVGAESDEWFGRMNLPTAATPGCTVNVAW